VNVYNYIVLHPGDVSGERRVAKANGLLFGTTKKGSEERVRELLIDNG
jgi:hypothetical protein